MDRIIVISGPTAVGKTKYAIEVAKSLNGEIVSCDSMQLYKFMNIGSAKPTSYEKSQVVHHLVDVIDPRDDFSVAIYQKMAKEAIFKILNKGKTPIISGGTGLYLNSLLYDMDFSGVEEDKEYREYLEKLAELKGPEYVHSLLKDVDSKGYERIHPNNLKKVIRALEGAKTGNKINDFRSVIKKTTDYEPILICLNRNRDELYNRINLRVDLMLEEGLIDEVRGLLNMGLKDSDISMKGIGYKEIISYLNGEISIEEATDLIKKNTRHLAKRQVTWFKRYKEMKWFNLSDFKNDEAGILEVLKWLRKK